jgi:hypothetical protein
MIYETGRVIGREIRVPDTVGIHDRVRSVEARTETTTRRDEHIRGSALDQLALNLGDQRLAPRSAGRLSGAARVGANEEMSSRHSRTMSYLRSIVSMSRLFF